MGHTVGKVESGFAVVVIVVSILGIIGAVIAAVGSGKLYDQVGQGDFALDRDHAASGPAPGSAAARAEAEAEIRQLVEAKSARREARGEAPLDIDAEVAALTRPQGHDAALRDEVRQLVIARNERRLRRGEAALDVEAEVDRQLRELGS
ncbi:MAG TPA: hypothetical protein VGI67_21260 [Thermoleophilaceae bacterium]